MGLIHDLVRAHALEEVERLLVQDPTQVHSLDREGYTPLHYASSHGDTAMVTTLLQHGADLHQPTREGQQTALYLACLGGHVAVVEVLLERGADPTLREESGWSSLHAASCNGHGEVVKRLLGQGGAVVAGVDGATHGGVTPLWWACHGGHAQVVRMLLEARANPSITRNDGVTAMEAAAQGNHLDCLQLLEEWWRSYILTKARRLHELSTEAASYGPPAAAEGERLSLQEVPAYLKGRVEAGGGLPRVELMVGGGDLLGAVVEYVVAGGMRGELFVDLMEIMGTGGV